MFAEHGVCSSNKRMTVITTDEELRMKKRSGDRYIMMTRCGEDKRNVDGDEKVRDQEIAAATLLVRAVTTPWTKRRGGGKVLRISECLTMRMKGPELPCQGKSLYECRVGFRSRSAFKSCESRILQYFIEPPSKML